MQQQSTKTCWRNSEHPPSEVIISGSNGDLEYIAKYTDKKHQKQAILDYAKPLTENPVAFLIVKDMLLTGFDAPIAQVMYIDRKLQDHTLKDEIPKLKAAHTRAMAFFKGINGYNKDDYILALKDETVRSQFEIALRRFAKQMDVILPNVAARPFIADLKLLGKVHLGARTFYRDDGMDISDAGEKVRQLVDEHIISTGVDPKIPPVDLLAANFKESLQGNRSKESQASEVESAIKHHITVNLDEDPEYYKSLSLRLRDIIEKTAGNWDKQYELLLEMVDTIDFEHKKAAQDIGLSETEFSFYNILMVEVTQLNGEDTLNESLHDEIKIMTQTLVSMFDEATQIVDFFNKPNEVKRVRKDIRRTIIDASFDSPELRQIVMDRYGSFYGSR